MKKIVSLLVIAVLLISSAAISSFAAAAENEKFDIPKANQAPVIDGKIDGDEWDNALVRTLNADNITDVTNTDIAFQGATFRWMWDDAGMYVFAEITDATAATTVHAANAGSYNSGDGIQICVYASPDGEGSTVGTLFFYSLVIADDGNAYIGEHFVYGDGGNGADIPASEAAVAAVAGGSSYTVEAFIAKEAWAKSDPAIVIAEGASLPLANIVMDQNDTAQALFTDTAWFSGINSNKYTLTSASAGHIEAEVVEAAPEEAAEAAPVATAPATVQTAAPQTSDNMVIFMALIAVTFAAVLTLKRKAR